MTSATDDSLITDELREAHANALFDRAASNTIRLTCVAPAKAHSVIAYIGGVLLPDMIGHAQSNYRNGYLADCIVDVEFLRDRRHELIEYCRNEGLKMPNNRRDSSGNVPVSDWVALVMTRLAQPRAIKVDSYDEGMGNVPYIRLTLS